MEGFAERLAETLRQKRTPTMVGIDPQWSLLPPEIQREAMERAAVGESPAIYAYRKFSLEILDAIADLVGVVKFQMAFFEALGPTGLQVLASLTTEAKSRGLMVVLDGKRNDIGSSAGGYAEAYLAPTSGPFALRSKKPESFSAAANSWPDIDALTVNPFLGRDGLTPFVDAARSNHRGVFVLVRTSNPGADDLQTNVGDGKTVSERVAGWIEEWSAETSGGSGYGPIGAVVGATAAEPLARMRSLMPSAWLLIPGFGVQGGGPADVAGAFDGHGMGALVNNSRGILYAYREARFQSNAWKDAARAATGQMIQALKEVGADPR